MHRVAGPEANLISIASLLPAESDVDALAVGNMGDSLGVGVILELLRDKNAIIVLEINP